MGKYLSLIPFSSHREALQIHFYYDDVEVCNPLGSKAKIHKLGKKNDYIYLRFEYFDLLGLFYFTLGNMRPKYRSKLTAIHVISIVHQKNISTYGIDAVIKPFVDDIKKLVSGMLNIVRSYSF